LPEGTAVTASKVNQFFTLTVNAFDSSNAPALTMFNAFMSRFNQYILQTEINGRFLPLFNANQGYDSPIRMSHPNVFNFSDVILTNRAGTSLNMQAGVGEAPAPNLAPGTRKSARYVQFTVSVDPRAAYTRLARHRDAAGLRPRPWTLGIQLPTETNANG
jgi:hypothetical protein